MANKKIWQTVKWLVNLKLLQKYGVELIFAYFFFFLVVNKENYKFVTPKC